MQSSRRIAIILIAGACLPRLSFATTYNFPPNPATSQVTLVTGDILNITRGTYGSTSTPTTGAAVTVQGNSTITVGTATNSSAAILTANPSGGSTIATPIVISGTGVNLNITVNQAGMINATGQRSINVPNTVPPMSPNPPPGTFTPTTFGIFSIFGYDSTNISGSANVAATINTLGTGIIQGRVWITGPLTLTTTGSGTLVNYSIGGGDTTGSYSMGSNIIAGDGSNVKIQGSGNICSNASVTARVGVQLGNNSQISFTSTGSCKSGGVILGDNSILTLGISGVTGASVNAGLNTRQFSTIYFGAALGNSCTVNLFSSNSISGGLLAGTNCNLNIGGFSQITNVAGSAFQDVQLGDGSTVTLTASGTITANIKNRTAQTLNNLTINHSSLNSITGNITAGSGLTARFTGNGGIAGSISGGNSSTVSTVNGVITGSVGLGTDSHITVSGTGRVGGNVTLGNTTGAVGTTASSLTLSSSGGVTGSVTGGTGNIVTLSSSGGIGSTINLGANSTLNMTSSSTVTLGSAVTVGAGSSVIVGGTGNINNNLTLGNNSSVTMGGGVPAVKAPSRVFSNGMVFGTITFGTGCTMNVNGGNYFVSNTISNNPIINIGPNGQISTQNYGVLVTSSLMTVQGYLYCDFGVTRNGPTAITGTVDTDQAQDWFVVAVGSGTSSMSSGAIIGAGSFVNAATFNMSGGNISNSVQLGGSALGAPTEMSGLAAGFRRNNTGATFTISGGQIDNTFCPTTGASVIFLNNGTFAYTGGTIASPFQNTNIFQVNGGNFTVGNTFSSTGSITVGAAGTLTLATVAVTGNSSVTNNGTIFVNSPGLLATTGALQNNAGANLNLVGSFNTGDYTSFANSGNMYFLGLNFAETGDIVSTGASSLTIGKNSLGTNTASSWNPTAGSYTFATINVADGSSFTTDTTFTNVNTALNIGNGSTTPATASINSPFSGTGGLSIASNSTLDIASTLSLSGVSGTLASGSTLNVNSDGTLAISSALTNNGTTNVSGTGIITGAFPGGSGSVLNIGKNSASTFSTSGNYANVQTINLVTSGTTFTSANVISGVDTAFQVDYGTAATFTNTLSSNGTGVITDYGNMTFNSATLSGFASINIPYNNSYMTFSHAVLNNLPTIFNNGIMTFNAGASPTTLTNVGTINMYAGSTLAFNDSINLNSTNITGAANFSNTSMTIASPKTVQTSAAISNLNTITIAGPSGVLQINPNGSLSGINNCIINGSLIIANGAQFTLNSGVNMSGTGTFTNSGDVFLNASNFIFSGSFNNTVSGVFSVTGQPTLQFSGSFTNAGLIVISFNNQNSLPQFKLGSTLDLTNGTFAIGYTNNYIAAGNYPFISSTGGPLTVSAIGSADLPLPNLYIKSWSLNNTGGTINVAVERTGFGQIATDPVAIQIGNYWETVGANSPNQSQLLVLNALESITNAAELNAALLELGPTENVPLQTLELTSNVLRKVQGRIKQTRTRQYGMYSSGDDLKDNGAWIRAAVGSAIQTEKNTLPGYKATYNGVIGGLDRDLSPWTKLGAAGSVYHSTVTSTANSATSTTINSYQAMIYGSFSNRASEYLDWIINGGVNNYHGVRGISIGTFNAVAVSHYTGQQLSLKAIASKELIWAKYYQLTPLASAQYSFLRQLGYQEEGAGDLNQIVQPNNVNLLELGVGMQFSVPFDQGNMKSIPEVHGMVLVDAQGGAVQTISQFISGGPLLTNTIQAGRLIGQLGGSMTLKFTDSVELIANYDFEWRHKYSAHDFYVNLRYIF